MTRWLILTFLLLPSLALAASRTVGPGDNLNNAASQLRPGDTLTLRDGTYQGNYFDLKCGSNATNGTAQAPITIKAEHERQAFLKGDGSGVPIWLESCAYWTIDGLRTEDGDFQSGYGNHPDYGGWNIVVRKGDHITLRRNLSRYNNRYKNSHMVGADGTAILIEENEIYSYHRHGFSLGDGTGITLRRNYANSRGYSDIDGGYGSAVSKSKGDSGFIIYPGAPNTNTLYENNISEDNDNNFWLQAHYAVIQHAQFLGNIALRGCYGFFQEPGDSANGENRDSVYANNVAVDPACIGFGLSGTKSADVRNLTALNAGAAAGNGFAVGACSGQGCGGGQYSVTSANILSLNGANKGIRIESQIQSWKVASTNSFNNPINYDPGDSGNYTNKRSQDAGLGACKVWIPTSSPMKGAGEGGADIGANVLTRYQDGQLTKLPLWDAQTGQFPCGAVVSGVNDSAGDSCRGVHTRLNVNANGCAFPPGYGAGTSGGALPAPDHLRVLSSQ